MLSLIVINGRQRGEVFHFDGDAPAPLGRGTSSIKLNDSRVSRRHCQVRFADGRWWIKDLGSTNGTWVNDEAIRRPTVLREGDQLRVGRFRLVVGQADGEASRTDLGAPAPADADEASGRSAAMTLEPQLKPEADAAGVAEGRAPLELAEEAPLELREDAPFELADDSAEDAPAEAREGAAAAPGAEQPASTEPTPPAPAELAPTEQPALIQPTPTDAAASAPAHAPAAPEPAAPALPAASVSGAEGAPDGDDVDWGLLSALAERDQAPFNSHSETAGPDEWLPPAPGDGADDLVAVEDDSPTALPQLVADAVDQAGHERKPDGDPLDEAADDVADEEDETRQRRAALLDADADDGDGATAQAAAHVDGTADDEAAPVAFGVDGVPGRTSGEPVRDARADEPVATSASAPAVSAAPADTWEDEAGGADGSGSAWSEASVLEPGVWPVRRQGRRLLLVLTVVLLLMSAVVGWILLRHPEWVAALIGRDEPAVARSEQAEGGGDAPARAGSSPYAAADRERASDSSRPGGEWPSTDAFAAGPALRGERDRETGSRELGHTPHLRIGSLVAYRQMHGRQETSGPPQRDLDRADSTPAVGSAEGTHIAIGTVPRAGVGVEVAASAPPADGGTEMSRTRSDDAASAEPAHTSTTPVGPVELHAPAAELPADADQAPLSLKRESAAQAALAPWADPATLDPLAPQHLPPPSQDAQVMGIDTRNDHERAQESSDEQHPEGVLPDARRIAFLVDASGSSIDTLPLLIDWLSRQLDELNEEHHFTIVFFRAGEAIEIEPRGLRRATDAARQRARQWMSPQRRRILPEGRSGFGAALAHVRPYRLDAIYMLCDGAVSIDGEGDGKADPQQQLIPRVEALLGETPPRFYVAHFFYTDGEDALRGLAAHFDGEYRFIPPRPAPSEALPHGLDDLPSMR